MKTILVSVFVTIPVISTDMLTLMQAVLFCSSSKNRMLMMSLLLPQRNLNPQIIQSLLLHLENCIIFWASLSKFKMDAT